MNATQAYHGLIKRVRSTGEVMPNRTGVETIKEVGEMIKIDLRDGYPILTTKQTYYRSAANETYGFFRGLTSAADFRALGVKVWDKNANEHGVKPNAWLDNPFREGVDHLGAVYGDQWRNWPGYKVLKNADSIDDENELQRFADRRNKLEETGWTHIGYTHEGELIYYKSIDQIRNCVETIIDNPTDRRIIFHAWNVAMLDAMALPPCHLLYQFFPNPNTKRMDMIVYLRSNDLCLGTPFNMVGAATVLISVARVTGYEASKITMFIGDAHVYANQHEYLDEQMSKVPYAQPTFKWKDHIPGAELFNADNPNWKNDAMDWLTKMDARTDFIVENYEFHALETPVPEMVV